MFPELSVSKERKAFLSSFLAKFKMSQQLILLYQSIVLGNKYQNMMEVVHKNQKLKSLRLRGITRLERRARFYFPGCYQQSSQATLCSMPPSLDSLIGCMDILAEVLSFGLGLGYSFLRQLLNFTTSLQLSGLVLRSLMKSPRNLLAQLFESLFMSLAFIQIFISFLLTLRPWRRLFLLEDWEELRRWDNLDCESLDLICLVDSYDLLRSELEQKLFCVLSRWQMFLLAFVISFSLFLRMLKCVFRWFSFLKNRKLSFIPRAKCTALPVAATTPAVFAPGTVCSVLSVLQLLEIVLKCAVRMGVPRWMVFNLVDLWEALTLLRVGCGRCCVCEATLILTQLSISLIGLALIFVSKLYQYSDHDSGTRRVQCQRYQRMRESMPGIRYSGIWLWIGEFSLPFIGLQPQVPLVWRWCCLSILFRRFSLS